MANPKKVRPQGLTDQQWRRQQILDTYGPEGTIVAGEPEPAPAPEGNAPEQGKKASKKTELLYFEPKAAEEYNSIKLPVPEGLTPITVALVAMGAGMDSERYDLSKTLTSSSTGGTYNVNFNQAYHYMNICYGEKRVRGYSDIMLDSRKQAKHALEEYAKGNHDLVNKYLRIVAKHAKESGLGHVDVNGGNNLEKPAHEMRVLVNELINSKEPDLSDVFTEKDRIISNSTVISVKATDDSKIIENKLKTAPPAAGSDERKRLVEDMMFDKMLAYTHYYGIDVSQIINDVNENEANKYLDSLSVPHEPTDSMPGIFNHAGFVTKDNEEKSLYSSAGQVLLAELSIAMEKSYVSPIDVALYEENGKQKLKDKFMPFIRELPEFKAAVDAKNADEMKKAVENINRLKLDVLKDKVNLDETKANELTQNDTLYKDTVANAHKTYSKAVCRMNSNYFADRIKKLEDDKKDAGIGEVENKCYNELKALYAQLKEFNDNYDHTKGPIANDPEYKKLFDKEKRLGKEYDRKMANKQKLGEQLELLNSEPKNVFQLGHQDSDEIVQLRAKVYKIKSISTNFDITKGSLNDDPEYQKALLEAYKASIAYQKKVAKSNYGKKGWEPSPDMGKDRYRGALEIERLALEAAPELIVSEMSLQEQREQIESTNNKKDFDNIYKDTLKSINDSVNLSSRRDSLVDDEDIFQKEIVPQFAKLIALKTVNKQYEDLIARGYIREINNSSLFNSEVKQYAEQIMERDDFKRMMDDNSLDDLITAATVKSGKGLMSKLGDAHVKVGNEKAIAKVNERKNKAAELDAQKAPAQPALN